MHDLNEHVLKPSGDLRDGAELRLGPMLRKLVSRPSDSLEVLLKQQPGRCDASAAQLLQLHREVATAPQQHSLPNPPGDDTDRKAALDSLSVIALHKLAVSEGVDVMTTLKTAIESDHTNWQREQNVDHHTLRRLRVVLATTGLC